MTTATLPTTDATIDDDEVIFCEVCGVDLTDTEIGRMRVHLCQVLRQFTLRVL